MKNKLRPMHLKNLENGLTDFGININSKELLK